MHFLSCRRCDRRYLDLNDTGSLRCPECEGRLARVWMPEIPRAEAGSFADEPGAYASLDDFVRADPARLTSSEIDFGLQWRGAGRSYRAAWIEDTGELYVVQLGPPEAGGGHVEVLGVTDRAGVESALEGWRTHCGERGSLTWIRARAGRLPRRPRRALRRAGAVALGATVVALGVSAPGQEAQPPPSSAGTGGAAQSQG